MQKPWQFGARSHERAVANARAAATQLSRARVERTEIEHWLAVRYAEPQAADQPA